MDWSGLPVPKTLAGAEVGELVQVSAVGQHRFSLVVDKRPNGVVIGVIECAGTPAPGPFWLLQESGNKCLSFGVNWYLELMPGEETWIGNTRQHGTPGVVHLTGSGPCLHFAATERMRSPINFDLSANAIAEIDHQMAAPVLQWRIWSAAAERDKRHSTPLVTFGVAAGAFIRAPQHGGSIA